MKKTICNFLIISVIFLLIAGCSDNSQIENTTDDSNDIPLIENIGEDNVSLTDETEASVDYTLNMADEVWGSLNTENMGFQNKDDFIEAVEFYIKDISEFVSKENWFDVYNKNDAICHVEILITDGISRVEVRNMGYHIDLYLRKDFFEHDLAPIAHEIAHVIVPWQNRSLSLSEGLSSYLQDKFGKNPSVFNWGINPHTLGNLFLSNDMEAFEIIFPVIGTTGSRQNDYINGELRQLFYIMSNSFATYLIETFGIENFINVYESDNLIDAYNIYCGKSFDDIKLEWREFLESYQEIMTFNEYSDYMSELYAKHNYQQ